ncbi:MAG TPA: LysM peptidoglycan-binding domain-containing protein, partial [Afifellaceae bacterium]|nr:LysM peptidoglycan-binding domain-containing protein [Afifellaceae bacterium]
PDTPSGEVLVVATRAGEPSEILSLPSTSSGSTATDGGKQADSGTATEMASSESAAPVKPGSEGQTAAETGMASESTQGSGQETQMAATDIAPSGAAGPEEDPQKSASQKSAALTEGSSGKNQTVDGHASNASESGAGSAAEATAQASQPPAAVDASGQQASTTDTMGTETETAETASESPVPTAESTQMAAATPEANEAADAPSETASTQLPAETAEAAATGDEGAAGEMAADSDKPMSESTQMASADQGADTPLSGSLASASEQETETAEAESAPAPVAEAPKRVFKLALDAVETEGSMVYAAGTGNPGAKVRVYADDTFIGETAANDSGRWLLETNAEIAAGNVVVRADELASGGTDVVQRAEVPFLKQVDAIALLPTTASTGGGASESSSGAVTGPTSVIIRKGDNLWTISRRTYGRGFRYTTIYQANDDQIRNPHMIFPGQVFVLPKGEKNWVQ